MPPTPADAPSLLTGAFPTTALLLLPALAFLAAAVRRAPGTAGADAAAAAWRRAKVSAAVALGAALLLPVLLLAGAGGVVAGGWLRLDAVGAAMALLVAFIGWVIVRYSATYLRGEPGEAAYAGWLSATLAAVMLVVLANHLVLLALGWAATSLALHRLLTFFGERPAAVMAAHKKFVAGRAADTAMLVAVLLLATSLGTLRLDELARQAAAGPLPLAAQVAVVLVVVAALLKCAQLPFHGWLIQVMEAPTPVSALLHAGIVNLGGFVLIRLAALVAEVPAAQGLLVGVGGFTAVVAALVMATRISIKVQLAWSTAAQMGFMLVQCGLGLWEMALLHLVAHSLYKAHAFLAAGEVVRQTGIARLLPAAAPGPMGVVVALAAALATTAAAVAVFGALASVAGVDAGPLPPALLLMAGIVALAVTPLLQPGGAALLRGVAMAFAVALLYLVLHAAMAGWVAPGVAAPAAPWWALVALAFGVLFALQTLLAVAPNHALARRLYPWFYGGLFLDERVWGLLFRLSPPPAARPAAPALSLQPAAPAQTQTTQATP